MRKEHPLSIPVKAAKTLEELKETRLKLKQRDIPLICFSAKVICWDGISRDVRTTQDTGKRAMFMHLLLQDEHPLRAKESSAQKHQRTVFRSGFLSEATAIGVNLSYSRPHACKSGNGAVLEVHATDAACFYERSREMTKNALQIHLKGFEAGEDGAMTIASLGKDPLVNKIDGFPQIGNGSSLAAYSCIAENRGIRADSRGKQYDKQGIIALSLMNQVRVYQTKVGDLNFESLEHQDILDLSNMVFFGCNVRKVHNIFPHTVTSLVCENVQPEWQSVTPSAFVLRLDKAIKAAAFTRKSPKKQSPFERASDWTARRRSLEIMGAWPP